PAQVPPTATPPVAATPRQSEPPAAARTDSARAASERTAPGSDSVRTQAAAPTAAQTAAQVAATIPANARFTVQLAAYNRLDQAQDLVRRLAARRVEARVDGTAAPFRVRTGYFTTRAQAAARLSQLKA